MLGMTSIDPRIARTREALKNAVIALAQERPVRTVKMAELARNAGVHRTTVYEHTTSPEALLIDTLRAELDQARTNHVIDKLNIRNVTLAVLDHLERFDIVYRRELSEEPGLVRAFLIDHFATSIEVILDQIGPTDQPPLFDAVAPQWIAAASVAAMGLWISEPAPRDKEAYLSVQAALMPAWWVTPSH